MNARGHELKTRMEWNQQKRNGMPSEEEGQNRQKMLNPMLNGMTAPLAVCLSVEVFVCVFAPPFVSTCPSVFPCFCRRTSPPKYPQVHRVE